MGLLRFSLLIFSVTLLLFSACVVRQPRLIKAADIQGEWYASNDDSLFFKGDSIVLLKRSDNNLVLDKMCISPDLAREKGLLNCEEFVNLRLKTRNRFEMWLNQGYTSEVWLVPMKWYLIDDILVIESDNLRWNYAVSRIDTVGFYDASHFYHDRYLNQRLILQRLSFDSSIQTSTDSVAIENDFLKQGNTLRNLDTEE